MLENFRKKITTVIQNIEILDIIDEKRDGHTPTPYRYQVPHPVSPTRVPRSINLSAGFRQLDHNQELWHSIRCLNEKNANMAAELDERILDARKTAEKRLTDILDLNASLAIIPSIVDQFKSCTEMIDEISSSMAEVEKKLMNLEDLVEVLQLQERQLDRRFEMAMYKEKKMAELDLVREKLAKEHAENVGRHEKGMMKIQQERQLVFQDAFQDDLKHYKETGSIPKVIPMTPPSGQELSLEEVVLDDSETSKELNDFLAK